MGEIGLLPEFDLGGRHMDAQVRTQPFLHPFDQQPADVVHVHMGQHEVGDGAEIDAGGFQPFDQLARSRQVQVRVKPQSGIDKDGLFAAAHHHHVQRPVERVGRQEHIMQPFRPHGRIDIVGQHGGW